LPPAGAFFEARRSRRGWRLAGERAGASPGLVGDEKRARRAGCSGLIAALRSAAPDAPASASLSSEEEAEEEAAPSRRRRRRLPACEAGSKPMASQKRIQSSVTCASRSARSAAAKAHERQATHPLFIHGQDVLEEHFAFDFRLSERRRSSSGSGSCGGSHAVG